MPTSDDPKPGQAVQPAKAPRRAVSASDYRMPKPYRKPVYADETQQRMSPRQVLMFTGGATLVAGLIFTLALLARSHSDSVKALEIAAAPGAAAPATPSDPDVDLIAIILTLFPQPASGARAPATPVCVAPTEKDDGCEQLQTVHR